MPAILVQTTSVGSADFANATVTFSSPVTAGNVIIVYGAVEEFGTPAPALSSNRGDTFVTTSQNNNNNAAVLARVDSAVGGSTTITLTGGSYHRLVAQEWSGMTYDATAGTGTATATGTITATTPGSATAASTSFSTFAVRTGDTYGAQTAPTGYTESGRFTSGTRGQFIGAYRVETTSGAKSAQWVDPPVNASGDSRAAIIFNFADASSGNSYTITPSGGISLSGTVVGVRERVFSVSGGVTLSGTAPLTFANGSVTYTITPSGGVVFSGTVNTNVVKNFSISGGVQFSGTVFLRRTKAILPTGAISFSGNNVFTRRETIVPSGALTFSGTAPITYNGIPPANPTSTRRPMTFVGQ